MALLVVDPAVLDGAGASLTDVGKDIGLTVSTLTGALSGCGSMCGSEAVGRAYDRSAGGLVAAMVGARNGLVNLGDGVRMSAFNYSVAEAQSDVSRRAQPLPVPVASGKISGSAPPSSVGAGDSAPAGWGWVAKYIGMIWPFGDSAKLRSAAGAWMAAGTQLLTTETSAAGPLGIVGGQQIPEGEAIGQAFSVSLGAASQIMSATAVVAGQLSSYADQIDEVHAAILDLLSRICDPLTGVKEVWDVLTGEDEDEIAQIAQDIRTVVDNFSAEASALASELSTAVSAAGHVVSEVSSYADKEWDQFLHGTDVGRVFNQVGQYAKGTWGEGLDMIEGVVTDAWKYNPTRLTTDPMGFVHDVGEQAEQMAPLVGLGGDGAPGVVDVWKQVGKDTVHWDLWGTNPAEAAGRSVVDVASVFIPGGLGVKASRATHALEGVADHVPGALDNVAGRAPDPVVPPMRSAPEVPAPRPVEPAPGAPVPADRTPPSPASRSGEPASAPVDAPRAAPPTESRPSAGPAGAADDASSAPRTAPAGATDGGGRPVGEPVSGPAGGAGPAGAAPGLPHVPTAAPGAPPRLPDVGGLSSSAAGAGDDLVPAGLGAHSAEAAEVGTPHGHGSSGAEGFGSGSDSGGSHGSGSDHPESGADPTPPGDHDSHDRPEDISPEDIPPLLHRETPYDTGGIQPDYVGEQYPGGHFDFMGSTGVTYLDEVARESYRITIRDGLVYDADGGLFDTSNGVSAFGQTSDGRAIFVMDEHGNLYASLEQEVGRFHHSSFFGGNQVAAAGELVVKDGRIEMVTDHSGHYQPGRSRTQQVLDQLSSQGIDIDPWDIDYWAPPGT